MNVKEKAVALGFKLMHDYKTNLVHLSHDGIIATCNSRFNGFETEAHYADDLACLKCLAKIKKELLTIDKTEDLGLSASDGKYTAICNLHDTCVSANFKNELVGIATEEFCDCCRNACTDRSYVCPGCEKGGA